MEAARSTFTVDEWKQAPVEPSAFEIRSSEAVCFLTYRGELMGESRAEFVFMRVADAQGTRREGYVATEHVRGRLSNRSGSFVLYHGGMLCDGCHHSAFGRIVPGSASRELRGLAGHVEIDRRVNGVHAMKLLYTFRREPSGSDADLSLSPASFPSPTRSISQIDDP